MRRSWTVVTQWSFSQNSAPSALWCFWLMGPIEKEKKNYEEKVLGWIRLWHSVISSAKAATSGASIPWLQRMAKRLSKTIDTTRFSVFAAAKKYNFNLMVFYTIVNLSPTEPNRKIDPPGCIPLGQSVAAGCEHARPRAFLVDPSGTRTGSGSVSSQCRAGEKKC